MFRAQWISKSGLPHRFITRFYIRQNMSSEAKRVPDMDSHTSESKRVKVDHTERRNDTTKYRDAAGYPKSRQGKEKKGKNVGRNSRRGTRTLDSDAATDAEKKPRLPKRQCALLIGFCGSGYSGMQIQPNTRTIEGTLFAAMVRAGAVSQDNADDPVKVNLGRAARTDAGVHAAGNVVSLKMITSVPDVPDIVTQINQELPPEIRLWGYVRVQNSFSARVLCDSRKYTYFFPSYLLLPPKPDSGLSRAFQHYAATLSPGPAAPPRPTVTSQFWEEESEVDELVRKRAWRVPPEQISILRDTARKFEGTHNFHNFTVAREFSDRSNQRHMKNITISDPVVYGETEWISVLFHGQSFMLHQRKMMSALVLSCRTNTPGHFISELYGPHTVFIPKMPSLGLLLEHPIFDSYNTRMESVNQHLQPTDTEYRPPIDFAAYKDEIEAFKETYIYRNMREVEDRDGLFDAWMRTVDAYSGNDLLYLNPKGIVPTVAIIKKGERRANPFREKRKFDATSFAAGGEKAGEAEDVDEDEVEMDKRTLVDTEG
ncbi:pseudouridine synthase [Infundibulicybe gibba]|nr:pseudouridine synthase [Infundibulicybe gibba]